MSAIAPSIPTDFIALRRFAGFDPDGGAQASFDQHGVGTPCANATNVPVCMAALEALAAGGGWWIGDVNGDYVRQPFVFTRADEVGAIRTYEELVAFAAPIESPAEAGALVVFGPGMEMRNLDCNQTNARETAAGFEILLAYGSTCGGDIEESRVLVTQEGTVTVLETRVIVRGDPGCVIGRLTDGVSLATPGMHLDAGASAFVGRTLGDRLANMASLEAVAVVAIERLARELVALGAPLALVERARRSARDEVRHAQVVGAIAMRRGGIVAPIHVQTLPARDRLAIAIENAVEGMVRETHGAVLATYQANTASDHELAELFTMIARDETGHAALSLDLARWLDAQLTESERATVLAARDDAARALYDDLASGPDEAMRESLGLPDAACARRLFAATFPTVWA